MTGSKGAAETEFTGENPCTHNASEFSGVIAWICGMRTSDAEEIQHSALRLENGATTNGPDFDRGHRDADLEIAIVAEERRQHLSSWSDRHGKPTYFRITVMQLLLSTF